MSIHELKGEAIASQALPLHMIYIHEYHVQRQD